MENIIIQNATSGQWRSEEDQERHGLIILLLGLVFLWSRYFMEQLIAVSGEGVSVMQTTLRSRTTVDYTRDERRFELKSSRSFALSCS